MTYFLFFVSLNYAQQFNLEKYDTLTNDKVEINFKSVLESASTSLSNSFVNKFIIGGEISSSLINQTSKEQKNVNRYGFDFSNQIELNLFNFKFGESKKYSPSITIGQTLTGGVVYSNNWFDLIFKGNETIENEDFSGFNQRFISFQKIGLGLINTKTKSSFKINFYGINNYQSLDFSHLKIIQDNPFDSIRIQALGDLNYNVNNQFLNGVGVGFDLDFRHSFNLFEDEKSIFQFKVNNLGIGVIQQNSHFHFNTDKVIEGYSMNQITSINNDFPLKDTLGILEERTKNKMVLLPSFYQIAKLIEVNSSKKLQSFYGVRGYINLPYMPMLFIGGNYQFFHNWSLNSQISIGGYSNARISTGINYNGNHLQVQIGTNDIYGLVSSKGYNKSFLMSFLCGF